MSSPFERPGLWLKDTAERVVSSAAEAALGIVAVAGFGLVSGASWSAVAVAAGTAALATALKSLVAKKVGDPDSASLNPRV